MVERTGLGGYRDQLIDGGFDHARALAAAGAVGEVAGGALLILGLITPVAAAVVLAVMIDAWCLKQSMVPGLQYFGPEGVEYETMLGAAAAAIVLTGPGASPSTVAASGQLARTSARR
ncbi:DoxX family membrane protein [Prescottella defluvii]|nr:DoxX family membrane protein [Prescottella defluvii]